MSQPAGVRLTFGTLLGTLNNAANTASNSLDAASSAVDMLNSYIQLNASKQKARHKLELAAYQDVLLEEKSAEDAARRKRIDKLCEDPDTQKYFNEAYARFSEILAEK